MTYTVSSGTLNPTQLNSNIFVAINVLFVLICHQEPTHSLTHIFAASTSNQLQSALVNTVY